MSDLSFIYMYVCMYVASYYISVSGFDPFGGFSRLPHIGPLLHGALQSLGLFLVNLHIVHFLIRGHR